MTESKEFKVLAAQKKPKAKQQIGIGGLRRGKDNCSDEKRLFMHEEADSSAKKSTKRTSTSKDSATQPYKQRDHLLQSDEE